MPRTPTGFYRSLWQAQDAMHCRRRTHPAFAADCCGFKHRGDRWDAYLWAQLTECMSGGNPARVAELGVNANDNLAQMASDIGGVFRPSLGAGFYGWATFIAFDTLSPVAFLTHDVPGHTDIYDLRSMAHYTNFPGGFPAKWRSTGRWYAVSKDGFFGDIWLNPL